MRKLHGRFRLPQRGVALIWVIVSMVLLTAAMLAAFMASDRAAKTIQNELQYNGQALNIARAGIADSLSWFRRQTTQPVTLFDPKRNLAGIPPVNETDEPLVGLVRTIELSSMNRMFARYEVRRTAVQDVTALRGLPGAGTVWLVDSIGYVFHQENPGLPYNVWPNSVTNRVEMQTEVRRLSIVLPAPAAICSARGDACNFNNRVKVLGGTGIGVVYPPATGVPVNAGTIQGTPATNTVNPYNGAPHPAAIQKVFGVSDAELRSMADIFTTDPTTILSPLPIYRIIYVAGNITFDINRPLEGTDILVVNGNLTVAASSNSVFNGLVYVTGTTTINAPTLIRGAIVGNGPIVLAGAGDFVEVDYDPDVLTTLLQRLGQYRFAKPNRVIQ